MRRSLAAGADSEKWANVNANAWQESENCRRARGQCEAVKNYAA